jgi:multidrug transporter EmrE-like cation transporter
MLNNNTFLLLIILLISICELFGQSCLKYFFSNGNKPQYYIYAFLFYSIICFLLLQSYKYKGMGMVNVIWSGLSILVVLSTGVTFFGEKITNMDKIGILFVIFGIFLILYEGEH